LAQFPDDEVFSLKATSETEQTTSVVKGVRISTLFMKVKLAVEGKHDWKHLVIIGTATDGYQAVFSWPELVNTAVGDQALVIFERDAKPLDAREGSIALYSGADMHAGPRNVRWLKTLEVRRLD